MKPRSAVAVVLLAVLAFYATSRVAASKNPTPVVTDAPPAPGRASELLSWLPSVAQRFAAALTWATGHTPFLIALLSVVVVVAVVRAVRARMPVPQDPQRLYTTEQRAESFARAGGQCEYTGFLLSRCHRPAEHADHLHPWSRGGATSLKNCAAACARCNLSKGAKVLPAWRVKLLVRRRRRYYPPGVDTAVGQKYTERLAQAQPHRGAA